MLIPFTRIRLEAKTLLINLVLTLLTRKLLAFKTVLHNPEGRTNSWDSGSFMEMEKKREAIENCYRFPDRLERVLDAFSLDLDLSGLSLKRTFFIKKALFL